MKNLRKGFTTGACAAAAAKAAAIFLVKGECPDEVEIELSEGKRIKLAVLHPERSEDHASASVKKDAGDDPDITNGVLVNTAVFRNGGKGVTFEAGEGVGTVTKKGLSVPPGEPAINPAPRRMIEKALREISGDPFKVVVSIKGGGELAKRTFNPRLGIVGGLSVLGTTGIVRPYSHPALRESLKCTLDVALAQGLELPVFTAGNIGTRAAVNSLGIPKEHVIEVGNEWGYMLDQAAGKNVSALLALGHPGKLAKLAAGFWQTHSSRSDSAVLFVSALQEELFDKAPEESNTVEGIFECLSGEKQKVLAKTLAHRIEAAIKKRIGKKYNVCVALINMKGDLTGHHGNIDLWLKKNR